MIVTIEEGVARARSPEGKEAVIPLPDLLAMLAPPRPSTRGIVLPDGVKDLIELPGGRLVVVHETPPRVFGVRWVKEDSPSKVGGPGTSYRHVSIALPYLVVLALYVPLPRGGWKLSGANECFFRNDPLVTEDDELFYPALLNCSRFEPQDGHPLAWICTQHLALDFQTAGLSPSMYIRKSLGSLLGHLMGGGFNYSSEKHEASSWFTETVKAQVDPRLASVEAWEEASRKDAMFATEVPWLKTGRTLRQVAARIAENDETPAPVVETASDVARLILRGDRLRRRNRARKGGTNDAAGQGALYAD